MPNLRAGCVDVRGVEVVRTLAFEDRKVTVGLARTIGLDCVPGEFADAVAVVFVVDDVVVLDLDWGDAKSVLIEAMFDLADASVV